MCALILISLWWSCVLSLAILRINGLLLTFNVPLRAWTSFKSCWEKGSQPKICRCAVQLLDAFDVFPFLYIPGFYQIQFTAEPLLLCHFHWLEGGWLKEETSLVNCASRELQEQMWSEEISEHQFPDKNFSGSTGSSRSLWSWSHSLAWLPGRKDSWDLLHPGVLRCCFHAPSAINSTVVLKSFFLSLWTKDVSGENCFFSPLVKAKNPRVVLSFVIYT